MMILWKKLTKFVENQQQEHMRIIAARKEDAPLIGRAVTMAIGHELARELAGPEHTPEDVEALFADLAAREDSQYSYRNSLVALDGETVAGVLVCYDGEGLKRMRRVFFAEAAKRLGLDPGAPVDLLPEECGPDEFYLDSLAVWPEFRGRGIARALIEAGAERARASGKPMGLLCDKTNARARALYDSLGFRPVGERPFAGELMDHMRLEV